MMSLLLLHNGFEVSRLSTITRHVYFHYFLHVFNLKLCESAEVKNAESHRTINKSLIEQSQHGIGILNPLISIIISAVHNGSCSHKYV